MLDAGHVHVWQTPCVMDDAAVARLLAELSPADQARAARFVVEAPRRQLIAGHALLYRLLAHYLDGHAGHMRIERGPHGKPYLRSPQLSPPLEFNLSHSRDLVVMAFGRGCAVGIDVEAIAPLDDLDDLADAYFSPGERAQLIGVGGVARLELFYRCWTRKEAWLKLVGIGIDQSLNQVDVRVAPPGVTLVEVPTQLGYVATLAVAGEPVAIHWQTLGNAEDIFALPG